MAPPLTISLNALGTQFRIEILDSIHTRQVEEITLQTELFLNEFEKKYSRFIPDSLVSTLNTKRILDNPETEFLQILEYGRELSFRTQGIFNMLLGETLINRGYDSAYSFIPSITKNEETYPDPTTELDITPARISLHRGQLDLGGFGKGYVVDLLAKYVQKKFGLQYFLINGGGDIYATSEFGKPYKIYLQHPTKDDVFFGTTQIMNQGFAASSPHKRRWIHNGATYHHIINTKPERNENTFCDESFIVARNCVDADAFATVALLVNPEQLTDLAQKNQIAFATFTAPSTFVNNQAFVVSEI